MLGAGATAEVARLAGALLAVKSLVEGVTAPIRVTVLDGAGRPASQVPSRGQWRALQALLERVAARTGVGGLALVPADGMGGPPQLFERVVSERLALAGLLEPRSVVPADRLGDCDPIIARVVADSFESFAPRDVVSSADGVPLHAYAAGAGTETVVLAPACGMPAALGEAWIRYLAADRRVVTWESRGLFGTAGGPGDEHATDIGAQAADLIAVMDHYGARTAQVIGLCGGAVIALAAAAAHPSRITSLSLWHGAYGFGADYPKTPHQQGLIELMTVAARSRESARAVHAAFCRAVLTGTPAEVAHWVLYPYANSELLYRYCRLNLGITSTDVEPLLSRVRQPALVVTSRDDDIAHPEGSRRVAAGLDHGQLQVEPHGDHISVFTGGASLLRLAGSFLTRMAEEDDTKASSVPGSFRN